jgi:1,4-dihydroxy-2-naphthoate octaprenyltransferase
MTATLAQARRYSTWLAWFWLVCVLVGTLTPADRMPAVPGGDKLHHFVAFGVLCFLACLKPRTARVQWALVAGAIAVGGAIELIQPYVNRWGDWADFYANSGGALLGWALARLANARISRVS